MKSHHYLDFLGGLEQLLRRARNDVAILSNEAERALPDVSRLQAEIAERELLIPVVGAFSAGKSSLLNAIIGAELLPVAITPETAMPTELRYDNRERIEATFVDGRTQEFPLDALASLQSRASEIELVRLYAERSQLKGLRPLVLVDMPGFNSPLDVHNRAIAHYIGKGAHYLFVVSIEEGSLHTQTLHRMEEVAGLDRTFSVCVNKADLRPPQEVSKVRGYIGEQLADLGLEPAVCAVSQHDVAAMKAMLETIQPEALISSLYRAPLQQVYQTLDGVLHTTLEALGRDMASNQEAVTELETALADLERQRDTQLSATRSHDMELAIEEVLGGVSRALNLAVDQMARAAVRGQDDLARVASDEIRTSLTLGLKRATDQLSAEVVSQFARASAASLRMNVQIGEDWTSSVLQGLQSELMPMLLSATAMKSGSAAMLLGGGAALAKLLPHPILKAAALILVPLIGHLFSRMSEGQRLEQAKTAIREQLIPDVLRGLRPEVCAVLAQANEQAVSVVSTAFEQQLQAQRGALKEAQQRMQGANIEALHAAVVAVQTEIQALARTHQVI